MNNINHQLDEQRLLYMYQGFNAILKLLNQHLDTNNQPSEPTLSDAYKKADPGQIIAMAAMALKNGKITHEQYEKIFDAAMGIDTVETTAWSEPSWNEEYLEANRFLNQFRK